MYYKTSDQERITLGFGGHECNNGMHFCGLYETEEQRDEIALGFIRQGLIDNEHVLYAPAERSHENFFSTFSEKYPDEKILLHNNPHLTLNTVDELYYQDGVFSPKTMDRSLHSFYEASQKEETINIRATAEMIWSLERHLDMTLLMAYESRLNYFIPGKHWISICLYTLTRFGGQTIMKVLQTHPYTISKGGVITKNPYFVHPDEWLAENAPEYLN